MLPPLALAEDEILEEPSVSEVTQDTVDPSPEIIAEPDTEEAPLEITEPEVPVIAEDPVVTETTEIVGEIETNAVLPEGNEADEVIQEDMQEADETLEVLPDELTIFAEEETAEVTFADDESSADALKDFTAIVRQSEDYTCGPAALATLLTQLGESTSEEEVLEHISDVSESLGVSLLSLKEAALALNQNALLKKWTVDQVLSHIAESGDPVLIHDEKPSVGGHFSVIREYNEATGLVTLSDTEAGNIEYSVEDFKKIFTGYVLVIPSDESELIADVSTDLSDFDASLIYGKYVPVYIALGVEVDETTQKDILKFKACITTALNTQNKADRDAKREKCYSTFADALEGSGLSVFEESLLITSYNGLSWTDLHENSVGYKTLRQTLEAILANQKAYIAAKKEYDTQFAKTGLKEKDLPTWLTTASNISKVLTELPANILVLKQDQKTVQYVIKQLTPDIENGTFTYKGTTMKLGNVSALVTAQTATVKTLSSSLTKKLSTLEGKIANKEISVKRQDEEVNGYKSEKKDLENAIANLKNNTSVAAKTKTIALKLRLTYVALELKDAQEELADLKADLEKLKSQKNDLSSDLTEENEELTALKKIKEFGENELKNKKLTFNKKKLELASIETQLEEQEDLLSSTKASYLKNKNRIDALIVMAASKNTLETTEKSIKELANKYGYSGITATNTDKTEAYLEEELDFIETHDDEVYEIAVGGTGDIFSLIVSILPIVGEGYDITTLLSGEDPLTGEDLTSFTKYLTLAGLMSGAGSGKIAREAGMEALEKVAEKLSLSSDELLPIAEKLVKKYDVDSLEELWELKDKFDLDKFMDEVEVSARALRASKALDELMSASSISELVDLADELKIPEGSKGLGKFFEGTADDAKSLFDKMTDGWDIVENSTEVLTKESPDGLYKLNFRTISSGKLLDAVESVDATIDVMNNLGSSSKIAEIKFGSLK